MLKITYQGGDNIFTWENESESDNISLVVQEFLGILVSAGYTLQTITSVVTDELEALTDMCKTENKEDGRL